MTAEHPLDRPIWTELTTRQASLALGGARALRYAPEYTPFGAAADASTASLAALKELAGDGELIVVEAEPLLPQDTKAKAYPAVVQMIWIGRRAPGEAGFEFVELGDEDAAEMQALAQLTKPGPFSTRTHQLGGFVGVRLNGRLVSMAGERMKPAGFSEVSGVCTHPDYRGNGYAPGLMKTVIARILARGETPFLHAYAANVGAIALYNALGFVWRRDMRILGLTA